MSVQGPQLPVLTPRTSTEYSVQYGTRVLRYLIEHECTATLTEEDLELADHAAIYAVAVQGLLPAVYARLSATRHLIARTLASRATGRLGAAPGILGASPGAPPEGPMAELVPRPTVHPPAPAYARPDVRF